MKENYLRQLLIVMSAIFFMTTTYSQDNDRQILRGKVLYRNVNVPNENVINSTAETATITNNNGEYEIAVRVGDELVFTAVNYQLKVVKITEEILKRNRLVVEVNEKVTQLDEVVVSPEDQEKFLEVQNEDFKKFEYDIDRGTEVENIAISQTERGLKDGINFVNIFKALLKSNKKKKEDTAPDIKVSEVLRQVYDDRFFIADLHLPHDKIDAFLVYCDAQMPARSLLKKDNEFQLIDFLVTHSKKFLEESDE